MIIFDHNIEERFTLAVQAPSKEDLHQLFIHHGSHTVMNIGIACLNPVDIHFNKSIGREIAIKNMQLRKCELNNIDIHGTKHHYIFSTDFIHLNKVKTISFIIKTIAEGNHVRLFGSFNITPFSY